MDRYDNDAFVPEVMFAGQWDGTLKCAMKIVNDMITVSRTEEGFDGLLSDSERGVGYREDEDKNVHFFIFNSGDEQRLNSDDYMVIKEDASIVSMDPARFDKYLEQFGAVKQESEDE